MTNSAVVVPTEVGSPYSTPRHRAGDTSRLESKWRGAPVSKRLTRHSTDRKQYLTYLAVRQDNPGTRPCRRIRVHVRKEQTLPDVTVKRIEDFENYKGVFYRARSGLGVQSFFMIVEKFPARWDGYLEHDHSEDGYARFGVEAESEKGTEEVYIVLEGSASLLAGGESYRLEPGVFARVGPGELRKITTSEDPVTILCLAGVPGKVFKPTRDSEEGAPWMGLDWEGLDE